MEAFRYVLMINLKYLVMNRKRNGTLIAVSFCLFLGLFLWVSQKNIQQPFSKPLHIGVIDNDGTIYSKMLVETYRSNKNFYNYATFETIENEASSTFIEKGLDGIIIIPESFSDSLMYFEHVPIHVKVKYIDPLTTGSFVEVMKSYANYIRSVEVNLSAYYDYMIDQGVDKTLRNQLNEILSYELIFDALEHDQYIETTEIIDFGQIAISHYYILSIIIAMGILLAVQFASEVHEEIYSSVYKRLEISGISPIIYWFSKMLAYLIFQGGICGLLLILIGISNQQFQFFSVLNTLIIIILVSSVFFTLSSLAFWIKDKIAFQMSIMMIMMFMLLLGGNVIPIHIMHPMLRAKIFWLPNFQIFKIIINQVDLINDKMDVLLIILTMVVSCLFLLISVKRFERRHG